MHPLNLPDDKPHKKLNLVYHRTSAMNVPLEHNPTGVKRGRSRLCMKYNKLERRSDPIRLKRALTHTQAINHACGHMKSQGGLLKCSLTGSNESVVHACIFVSNKPAQQIARTQELYQRI